MYNLLGYRLAHWVRLTCLSTMSFVSHPAGGSKVTSWSPTFIPDGTIWFNRFNRANRAGLTGTYQPRCDWSTVLRVYQNTHAHWPARLAVIFVRDRYSSARDPQSTFQVFLWSCCCIGQFIRSSSSANVFTVQQYGGCHRVFRNQEVKVCLPTTNYVTTLSGCKLHTVCTRC